MASTSTSATAEKKKMYALKTSDGHIFELDEAAARMSETINNMIEDDCAGEVIPLLNVDAATLTKVSEYCKRHTDPAPPEGESLQDFDKNFIEDVKDDQAMLFDLILVISPTSLSYNPRSSASAHILDLDLETHNLNRKRIRAARREI